MSEWSSNEEQELWVTGEGICAAETGKQSCNMKQEDVNQVKEGSREDGNKEGHIEMELKNEKKT